MADEENENSPAPASPSYSEESPSGSNDGSEGSPSGSNDGSGENSNALGEEEEDDEGASVDVTPGIQEPKEPKKKEPKPKKERPIPIPKDSASFFRARKKDPKKFTFTAEGDLQVPEMRGEPAKVIPLPQYREATVEEMEEGILKRYGELIPVEKEYDETLRLYKEAVTEWRDTGKASDVMKYQRDLVRLDAVRTRLRSPLLWTKEFKRLAIRDVLVDEFYQTKKLGYSAFALRMRSVPFEELVRIGEAAKVAEPTPEPEGEDAGSDEEGDEVSYVFFNSPGEPDHGLLSPDTMIEFVYNSTKYNCLTQAYEGERLKLLGRDNLRSAVLKQRNPQIMRGFALKAVGEPENARELWIEIVKALVAQHPRFGEVLRATGDDPLVYANPKEARYGIGLAADDPLAMTKSAWKGPNILGQTWQVVRGTLEPVREGVDEGNGEGEGEENNTPVSKGGGYTEHGRTAEESKEIRRNILKGYYKRMGKA